MRGGVEHRELKISQLKGIQEPNGYIYHENVSKNHPGTYQQLHLESKIVPIYSSKDAGDRCHVYLLDLYLSKLPREAVESDIFYVRPLQDAPFDQTSWYTAAPVGNIH